MIHSEYYEILCNYHSEGLNFQFDINWNLPVILPANQVHSDGYLVQHFLRNSEPDNFEKLDANYYEAWKVHEGTCVDHGNECDDRFCLYLSPSDSFKKGFWKSGLFSIFGDVYWIPKESHLFCIVDSWGKTVDQANGLKSSYEFPELSEKFIVFRREPFVHMWSFLTEKEIKDKALHFLLRYCQNTTKRDIDLLDDFLNEAFNSESMMATKYQVRNEWLRIRNLI